MKRSKRLKRLINLLHDNAAGPELSRAKMIFGDDYEPLLRHLVLTEQALDLISYHRDLLTGHRIIQPLF